MEELKLTPDGDPALEAWVATVRAYEASARRLERGLARDGLSIAKFDTLAAIARLGQASQQAVADELLVSKAGLATMIGRLERDGLVERRDHPADGRARLVSVTPAGVEALRRALTHQTEVVARTVARLSRADQRRLRAIMERLAAAAEDVS